MSAPDQENINDQPSAVKKCPECSTYLKADAKICTSCQTKVGQAAKHGIAKRPVDWMSYIRCILLWLLLGVYIWWAFFLKK